MKDNEQVMVVNKENVKTIRVANEIMKMLVVPAIQGVIPVARNSYERYQGAMAITKSVAESGLLPSGLRVKEDNQGKKVYLYQNAYGNDQQVLDVYSFFNDIAVESSDFGFNLDQMAVVFAYGYGYEGEVYGTSKEGMQQAQMEAYYELQQRKIKGASK